MENNRLNSLVESVLTWMTTLYTHLRNYLLTGFIVLIPVAVTIYISLILFSFVDSILGDAIAGLLGRTIPGVGLVSTILLFIFAGIIAQNVLGKNFLRWLDISLLSVPLIRSVYIGVKQVSNVIFQQKQWEFQRVVMVEYPKEDCWALGFITGDFPMSYAPGGFPGKLVCVFVPTTPNPTSGFVLIMDKSKVVDTTLGIEEAMKLILSGGLVKPGVPGSAFSQPMVEDFTIPR